jgi:hypothetical protein
MGTLPVQPFQGVRLNDPPASAWRRGRGRSPRVWEGGWRVPSAEGSCQLGPAPRRALRSVQLANCFKRRSRSAPAAQAARDPRTRRRGRGRSPRVREGGWQVPSAEGSPPSLPPATPAPAGHLATIETPERMRAFSSLRGLSKFALIACGSTLWRSPAALPSYGWSRLSSAAQVLPRKAEN